MRPDLRVLAAAAGLWLLGAAPPPLHVQTSDYFAGYEGTHRVAPAIAARWLTWAETNIEGSQAIRPFGVKTMLYTDPNRQISGEPLYTSDESTFAHDCNGRRITTERAGQYLMDPHSAAMERLWQRHVRSYSAEGHFDAIFDDDADDVAYVHGVPCQYEAGDWLAATLRAMRALDLPIVYNGLSNFAGHGVSQSIALNAVAIGGMMEECYAPSSSEPKSSGWQWIATQETELAMVRARKLFFCYGNDTSDADRSIDARTYAYASFLLTYDPSTSVLWEYYAGPSGLHVMPETQLVALQPERPLLRSVADLLAPAGTYERLYRRCYLARRLEGPCAVAVNPDAVAHPLDLRGYRRTLRLSGSGVLDGGTVRVVRSDPPQQLAPLSAVIAFR